jgi:hypothetical protein
MNKNITSRILASLVILIIIAIGFFGIFNGYSLFVDEDIVLLFQENSVSNKMLGWRSDAVYGASNFFSDPGTVHPWNLFGLWTSLFDNKVFGQNVLFVILSWAACVFQYLFLEKLVPSVNKATLVCLAVLILFGSLRYEFIFLYSNIIQIISASIGGLVLFEFILRPRLRHYFYYILIIWALVFLGSSVSLFQFLSFSVLFLFGMIVYYGWYKNWIQLRSVIWRYLRLNLLAGFCLFLLGGWIFYSLILDQSLVGYARTTDYTTDKFIRNTGLVEALFHFCSYFHAGFLSSWSGELGISQRLGISSWNNLSPITPVLIVIFMYIKSQNFWEFGAKFVVIGSYLYHEIFFWMPGFFNMVQSVIHLYPPFKMYPYIQVYQTLLIAFLIQRLICSEKEFLVCKKLNAPKIIALILSIFCMGGFFFILLLKVLPEYLLEFLLRLMNWSNKQFHISNQFLEKLIRENFDLLKDTLNLPDLLFYLTTMLILGSFIGNAGISLIKYRNGVLFAMILVINNFFLALSIYPLNTESLIWDEQKKAGFSSSIFFTSTDRIARVKMPRCRGRSDYGECVEEKFFNKEFGPKRYKVGYRAVPLMEFSRPKSFISQQSLEYFKAILRDPKFSMEHSPYNIFEKENIWSLFNMSAVNYLLSDSILPEVKQLEMVYKNKQFYLYRNINAVPYYYFASRIKTIEKYEDLQESEREVAYLWGNTEKVIIPGNKNNASKKLKLTNFENGNIQFKYQSEESEFLVISDSWHPHWRARLNGKEIAVYRTNGIFKGILLPPGKGTAELYFDNSLYRSGIWISVASWVLFFLIWTLCASKLHQKY